MHTDTKLAALAVAKANNEASAAAAATASAWRCMVTEVERSV